MKRRKNNKGASLIELIIYSGLLATVLTVLYFFYAQVAWQKSIQVTETEIYTNGSRILFDLRQTIRNSSSVGTPVIGTADSSLILDSGNISYYLDAEGRLVKEEASQQNRLTDSQVVVENLIFTHLGPSTLSSTIKISFTLRGKNLIEGKKREEDFQTAVSLP